MCIIWKALCPYVLDAQLGLWVSLGTRLYLCTYNQPSWATLMRCLPPRWVEAQEGYSLVVTCTRRRSICYPYSRHPLQAQAPLNLSVMACHSLERTQADLLCLSENLISQHARKSNRAEKLPSRPGFEPRPAGESHQASRHCGLFSGLDHWVTETDYTSSQSVTLGGTIYNSVGNVFLC